MVTVYASLGSVSSGTMREEDLIPTFIYILDNLREQLSLSRGPYPGEVPQITLDIVAEVSRLDNLIGEIEERMEAEDYFEGEDASWDLEALTTELESFAPPLCYFGSHEGGGADFGFWISWESIGDAEREGTLLRLQAGDSWEDNDELRERLEAGILEWVLEVTDHDNCSLKDASTGEEVWSN